MTATIETEFGFTQLRRRGTTVEHRKLSKRPWSASDGEWSPSWSDYGEWSPWTVRKRYPLRVQADQAISNLRASHDGEWGLTP